MCNFWARGVFEVPEVAALDYYLRLDDDSVVGCTASTPDPFGELRSRGAVYGFWKFAWDPVPMSQPWLEEYMGGDGAVVADGARLPIRKGCTACEPSFYNNFEIVDVGFMRRSAEIAALNAAVAKSNGIWRFRWGDAAIRFWQLSFALGQEMESRVWCVPTTQNKSSEHWGSAMYYRHERHTADCRIGYDAKRWIKK